MWQWYPMCLTSQMNSKVSNNCQFDILFCYIIQFLFLHFSSPFEYILLSSDNCSTLLISSIEPYVLGNMVSLPIASLARLSPNIRNKIQDAMTEMGNRKPDAKSAASSIHKDDWSDSGQLTITILVSIHKESITPKNILCNQQENVDTKKRCNLAMRVPMKIMLKKRESRKKSNHKLFMISQNTKMMKISNIVELRMKEKACFSNIILMLISEFQDYFLMLLLIFLPHKIRFLKIIIRIY